MPVCSFARQERYGAISGRSGRRWLAQVRSIGAIAVAGLFGGGGPGGVVAAELDSAPSYAIRTCTTGLPSMVPLETGASETPARLRAVMCG